MTAKEIAALADIIETAIPQPITSEWHDHDGKGRPHPASSYVEVEYRDGLTEQGTSAFISWVWHDDCEDVLRWREAPEPLIGIRAGEVLVQNAAVIAAALRAHTQEQTHD